MGGRFVVRGSVVRSAWLESARFGAALLAGLALSVPVAAAAGPHSAPDGSGPAILGWETIPLEGATCGRGAPFKYFFNESDAEDAHLLIFLMGGGACMKEGPPPPGATGTAAQLHCMAFSNFEEPTEAYHLAAAVMPILRRVAENPFADDHYAFIPYCTGDLHTGRATAPFDYDPTDAEFPVVHRGHLNLMAVLEDLASRVPSDRRVVLTGSSAGGLGAIFNYQAVASGWHHTVLVPDAGIAPGHPDTLMAREGERIAKRWGSTALLPDYCRDAECLSDSLHLLAAHARHHDGDPAPWRPFGYLQGQRDVTLANYLEVSPCTYRMALARGYGETRGGGNLRAYLPATEEHTFLARPQGFTSSSGVAMAPWFAGIAHAENPAALPQDAVDQWMACHPLRLPALWTP